MTLLAISIIDSFANIKEIAYQASPMGTIALKEINSLLKELKKESPLTKYQIYYSYRESLYVYLKTDGNNLYAIIFDKEPVFSEIERHFDEVMEINRYERYEELNKKIADPTYIASKIKRLREQIEVSKQYALAAVDKLILREHKIEDLVTKTAALAAEANEFSTWLKNLRQKRQKQPSLSEKIGHKFLYFFCHPAKSRPSPADKKAVIDERIKYGIN